MKKFLILSLGLLALSSHCLAKTPKLTLTQDWSAKAPLFNLMTALGYSGPNKLEDINAYAQKHLLRPANVERWDVHDYGDIESKREVTISTLEEFGLFGEVLPALDQTYENVLILGASVGRMRSRVAFFNKLVSQGLKFKSLYFLTGERPLDPKIEDEAVLFEPGPSETFRQGWHRPKSNPSTESDGARLVWDQLAGSEVKTPQYVDAPMNKGKRPSTVDTIDAWLAKKPTKGRTLVISNNPYVPYQHAVVVSAIMEKGFIAPGDSSLVTTVGAKTEAKNERLRVLLDNVARILYNEKKVWEVYSRISDEVVTLKPSDLENLYEG